MKRRKRGKTGGVKRKLKSRGYRPYLPSLIKGNVRSLPNKIDELCASTRYVNDFRTASLMPFTETWLTDCVSDELVNIDGFSFIRSDRTELSEKACGGGLGVYVNKKYCHPNNITVKHRSCSPNIEILILS